jgi:hypothetical protein
VVRGFKLGLLTSSDYNNLSQCETLDDIKLYLVRRPRCRPSPRPPALTHLFALPALFLRSSRRLFLLLEAFLGRLGQRGASVLPLAPVFGVCDSAWHHIALSIFLQGFIVDCAQVLRCCQHCVISLNDVCFYAAR